MGRFEIELLATDDNLAALADLSGKWINGVHDCNLPKQYRDTKPWKKPTWHDLKWLNA